MRNRYQRPTKTDANQSEIINYLRAFGVWAYSAAGAGTMPDLIIYKTETAFLEIKIQGSKAKYTFAQLNFIANTPAPVAIVKTKEAALQFAFNPRKFGLTQKQKNDLAGFLLFNKKKYYQPAEIEKILFPESTLK